jgi:hypothetical protein
LWFETTGARAGRGPERFGYVTGPELVARLYDSPPGYRGFHTRAALPPVMVGCGLLSLAYLLTASPLAAVGGHILLHTALTLRGTELPPYATGVPTSLPSDTNGQQAHRPRPSHRPSLPCTVHGTGAAPRQKMNDRSAKGPRWLVFSAGI